MIGSTEAVRVLISRGAIINEKNNDGNSALHFAASYGKTEVMKILLSAGADPELKNKAGERALESAEKYKRKEAVKILHETINYNKGGELK